MKSVLYEIAARMQGVWLGERGTKLALVATAPKGAGKRLALELGDILYELDPSVVSRPSRRYPDVVLVYSRLNPLDVFRRVAHWPPAYAQRVIPAVLHLRDDPESIISGVGLLLDEVPLRDPVYVEVVYRGSARLQSLLEARIAVILREKGYRVSRREARTDVKVECIPGEACIAALLPHRCDRVSLWFEQGVTRVCAPLVD